MAADQCDMCGRVTRDTALCDRCADAFEQDLRAADSGGLLWDLDAMLLDAAKAVAERQLLDEGGPSIQVGRADIDRAIPLAAAALRTMTAKLQEVFETLPARTGVVEPTRMAVSG